MAELNLAEALSVWADASEGGGGYERDGLVLARAAAPIRSFNNILVRGDQPDASLVADAAAAFFVGGDGRFRVRVREGVAPDDDAGYAAVGLRRAGGIPSLSISSIVDERRPDSLVIKRVDSVETLTDHVGVVADVFDWPPQELARVFTARLLADERWNGYVGYVDGEAVASSQLVVSGRTGGIYYVGTRASFRGAGFGEAITRRAVTDGLARGCATVSLQASPMGLPIYERMGFRQVALYRTYLSA